MNDKTESIPIAELMAQSGVGFGTSGARGLAEAMTDRVCYLYTVGFLQYVAPSGQFLLAVLAYREPFSSAKLLAFALIWIALGVFSLDTALAGRRRTPSGQSSS